jgi:hypothetical protein
VGSAEFVVKKWPIAYLAVWLQKQVFSMILKTPL